MSQRRNVTQGLWENTPVGNLDVLHLTPVDHLVFLTVTVVQIQTFTICRVCFSLFTSVEIDFVDFNQNLAFTVTFVVTLTKAPSNHLRIPNKNCCITTLVSKKCIIWFGSVNIGVLCPMLILVLVLSP